VLITLQYYAPVGIMLQSTWENRKLIGPFLAVAFLEIS